MSIHWSNHQNKRHHALFKDADRLDNIEGAVSWIEILFQKEMDKLNTRISKISPRRGKKERDRMLKEKLERDRYRSTEELDGII